MKIRAIEGGITAPKGFKAAGVSCGIKAGTKRDLALVCSEVPAKAAAVFTTNKMAAPPILLSRKNVSDGIAQAVLINSGNANACTGKRGLSDATKMSELVAEVLDVSSENVLVASTGVIGVPLPMEKVERGIKEAKVALDVGGHLEAAEAIMTTDTFPKEFAVEFELGGKVVVLGGMAKGSGMIAPNMATMLGFLSTDLAICRICLKACLVEAVNKSFNMITVDGGTSTNDMVVILANGLAGNEKLVLGEDDLPVFQKALDLVTQKLAKTIVKDGEGITKFLEITVAGAKTFEDAKVAAMTVANSNLVKTAFFGEDANWGRIIAAIGHSGAECDPRKVSIHFNGKKIVEDGMMASFDEDDVLGILKGEEIEVLIELGVGRERATVWTCDLSYDYVRINAAYRT